MKNSLLKKITAHFQQYETDVKNENIDQFVVETESNVRANELLKQVQRSFDTNFQNEVDLSLSSELENDLNLISLLTRHEYNIDASLILSLLLYIANREQEKASITVNAISHMHYWYVATCRKYAIELLLNGYVPQRCDESFLQTMYSYRFE